MLCAMPGFVPWDAAWEISWGKICSRSGSWGTSWDTSWDTSWVTVGHTMGFPVKHENKHGMYPEAHHFMPHKPYHRSVNLRGRPVTYPTGGPMSHSTGHHEACGLIRALIGFPLVTLGASYRVNSVGYTILHAAPHQIFRGPLWGIPHHGASAMVSVHLHCLRLLTLGTL